MRTQFSALKCPTNREGMLGPWTRATLSSLLAALPLVITKGPCEPARGGLTGGVDEFQTQVSGPRHSPTELDAGQEPEPSFHDVLGHNVPPWAMVRIQVSPAHLRAVHYWALGKDRAIPLLLVQALVV